MSDTKKALQRSFQLLSLSSNIILGKRNEYFPPTGFIEKGILQRKFDKQLHLSKQCNKNDKQKSLLGRILDQQESKKVAI